MLRKAHGSVKHMEAHGSLSWGLWEQFPWPYKQVLENIEKEGKVPPSWREAMISLTHKENMGSKEVKNYRLVLLLNVDYKIYATVLASRLKKILVQIIHQNQAGFLPRRHMRNNVRIIMNILEYYEAHPEKQMVLNSWMQRKPLIMSTGILC